MNDRARRLRERVVDRAVDGPGSAPAAARRAAFGNSGVDERVRPLVEKIVRHAWKVTGGDLDRAKAAGVPENDIFELAVCAALGQATRQLQAALAAVAAADGPTAEAATPPAERDDRGAR